MTLIIFKLCKIATVIGKFKLTLFILYLFFYSFFIYPEDRKRVNGGVVCEERETIKNNQEILIF